jgi:hypothetical protein
MEREFQASTREEAIRVADEWWKAQKDLVTITRYVYAANDGPGIDTSNRWCVLIHYRKKARNSDRSVGYSS